MGLGVDKFGGVWFDDWQRIGGATNRHGSFHVPHNERLTTTATGVPNGRSATRQSQPPDWVGVMEWLTCHVSVETMCGSHGM